jgi:hypothetical protein
MEIRNTDQTKTLNIPFTLNFTDDKEDLINNWVNTEGAGNINPIVDFEVDLYQYEGDNLSYQFSFFCCGDDTGGENSSPFYPYNKQTVFTKDSGYFINSYANTLRDNNNLKPTENQVIGTSVGNTNQWQIDLGGGNIKNVREVNVTTISNQALSESQFIFTYFNTNTLSNRKQVDKILVGAKSTTTGYDPFYYNKLIFTGSTGQTNFNLAGYNAINYSSVLSIFPNFSNFYTIPQGITYDSIKKPILNLDKYNKTLGNNIYLPKNNDLTELYLQVAFYNPKTGKSIQMVTKSGGTASDIINPSNNGTIFYRSQFTDDYTYIKLNLSSSTKTYGIRLYNPATESFDINPFNLTGGTVIQMYEKVISDVRVPGVPSNNLPPPTVG